MHRILILLPIVLAACMTTEPAARLPYVVEPVSRDAGWAGCKAEGGSFAAGADGGLICVVKN